MPLDSEKATVIGVHIGVPSDFELGVPLGVPLRTAAARAGFFAKQPSENSASSSQ